jgi:hypothetical protein
MKYIIEIDGVSSTKYTYNVWSVWDDYSGAMGKDIRIFASDDKKEFLEFVANLSQEIPDHGTIEVEIIPRK